MFIRGETLSAHNARPRKIPGWIVVVREHLSVNKRQGQGAGGAGEGFPKILGYRYAMINEDFR